MAKTKIEWCDFSINPVKGLCPMACSYCYARRMYKRFKWDETIKYDMSVWNSVSKIHKPSKIFVGSTMELFGKWIPDRWIEKILGMTSNYPQHTFIFLSKKPSELQRWSPFPKNCWVGVSTTGFDVRSSLEYVFKDIQATVKFVSIEPFLDYTPMDFRWVNWVIIGQQTPPKKSTEPHLIWLLRTAEEADKLNKPVFLKDNLLPLIERVLPENCVRTEARVLNILFDNNGKLRQEFPKGV